MKVVSTAWIAYEIVRSRLLAFDWLRLQAHLSQELDPAGRPRQLALIEQLRGTVARYWMVRDALPSRSAEWLADHDAIVEACRARSSVAARRRLGDHLQRVMDLVLARLAEDASGG